MWRAVVLCARGESSTLGNVSAVVWEKSGVVGLIFDEYQAIGIITRTCGLGLWYVGEGLGCEVSLSSILHSRSSPS